MMRAHTHYWTDACARTRARYAAVMSDTDVASWAALLRVHAALVPLIDRELQAACGLPLTWYDVLLELNSAPGRSLNMGELGEVAVFGRARGSRVVDQMAACRLVAPDADPRRPRPRDAPGA